MPSFFLNIDTDEVTRIVDWNIVPDGSPYVTDVGPIDAEQLFEQYRNDGAEMRIWRVIKPAKELKGTQLQCPFCKYKFNHEINQEFTNQIRCPACASMSPPFAKMRPHAWAPKKDKKKRVPDIIPVDAGQIPPVGAARLDGRNFWIDPNIQEVAPQPRVGNMDDFATAAVNRFLDPRIVRMPADAGVQL